LKKERNKMYTPINNSVYCSAVAGAVAGMAVAGNQPESADIVVYDQLAQVATIFAQEFDTVWNSADAVNVLTSNSIVTSVFGFWSARNPTTIDPLLALNPLTYEKNVKALIALIRSGVFEVTAQGITPDPIASGFSSVFTFRTQTPDNTPFQTIAATPPLPDNSNSVILATVIGKQPGQAEAIFAQLTYGFYRNLGSDVQQEGNGHTIQEGTMNIGGTSFQITATSPVATGLQIRVSPSINSPIDWLTTFQLITLTGA
jgi:hypothetical protein